MWMGHPQGPSTRAGLPTAGCGSSQKHAWGRQCAFASKCLPTSAPHLVFSPLQASFVHVRSDPKGVSLFGRCQKPPAFRPGLPLGSRALGSKEESPQGANEGGVLILLERNRWERTQSFTGSPSSVREGTSMLLQPEGASSCGVSVWTRQGPKVQGWETPRRSVKMQCTTSLPPHTPEVLLSQVGREWKWQKSGVLFISPSQSPSGQAGKATPFAKKRNGTALVLWLEPGWDGQNWALY